MAAILGTNAAMPKWKVVSNIWEYLRDNDLLDKVDSRRIYPDEKIKALVPSSMTTGEYITTQQLTRCINNHLAPNDGKKIGGKF
jgi:chromatin remodeling complex protein RSC6